MNNDTELIEFYKFLSERAIIDDCCRGEGEAECAVKLYNKSKVKNLDVVSVALLPENISIKDIKDVRQYFRTHDKTMREHKAYATIHYLIEHLENS